MYLPPSTSLRPCLSQNITPDITAGTDCYSNTLLFIGEAEEKYEILQHSYQLSIIYLDKN